MKRETIISIIMGIMVLIVIITVFMLGMTEVSNSITYIQCCNNNVCSDTYYTPKDNLCHLSLCESSPLRIFGNDNCTYEGANISITMLIDFGVEE